MMGDDSMPPIGDSEMDMGGGPDMGGEDPMAGGPDDMSGAPDDMGGEDPMAGGPDDMGGAPDDMGEGPDMGGSPEDDELMGIINNLSIEDKAAVTKYAKSMVDNNASGDDGGMMPESKFSFSKIIDETIGSLLNKKDNKGTDRPGKKLNSKQRDNKTNPFVSPY